MWRTISVTNDLEIRKHRDPHENSFSLLNTSYRVEADPNDRNGVFLVPTEMVLLQVKKLGICRLMSFPLSLSVHCTCIGSGYRDAGNPAQSCEEQSQN